MKSRVVNKLLGVLEVSEVGARRIVMEKGLRRGAFSCALTFVLGRSQSERSLSLMKGLG